LQHRQSPPFHGPTHSVQIGRELNVDAVMEGSVLRSDDQVRIAVHMIYAPADQNLFTETRDLGDVLKIQR